MKSLNLAAVLCLLLIGIAPISLFAQNKNEEKPPIKAIGKQSSFNFGISYDNYSAFYKSDIKGDISSNDSYLGIGCSYFVGENFTFYIGANFLFLFQMVNTLETDETPVGIRIGKSIFGNISADASIGVGYTFRFGKKSNLFLGGGIHSGLPHLRDSTESMFLAFNLGIDAKVSYRFYNLFFIGIDICYDFILIAPANSQDTFQGVGIIPSIGFVYDF